MFDMFNPALREAKRRAKAEYKQRMLQGKIDETMRRARENADRKLAGREKMHRDILALNLPRLLMIAAAVVVAAFVFG